LSSAVAAMQKMANGTNAVAMMFQSQIWPLAWPATMSWVVSEPDSRMTVTTERPSAAS
jgi:hypothetical protein